MQHKRTGWRISQKCHVTFRQSSFANLLPRRLRPIASDMKAWVLTYSKVETNGQKQTCGYRLGRKLTLTQLSIPDSRVPALRFRSGFWVQEKIKHHFLNQKKLDSHRCWEFRHDSLVTNQNHLRSQLCKHYPSRPIETWLWNHAGIHLFRNLKKQTSETNKWNEQYQVAFNAISNWNPPDLEVNETVHDSRIACSRLASNFTPQTGKFGTIRHKK